MSTMNKLTVTALSILQDDSVLVEIDGKKESIERDQWLGRVVSWRNSYNTGYTFVDETQEGVFNEVPVFAFDGGYYTEEEMIEANNHDDMICEWVNQAKINEGSFGLVRVA